MSTMLMILTTQTPQVSSIDHEALGVCPFASFLNDVSFLAHHQKGVDASVDSTCPRVDHGLLPVDAKHLEILLRRVYHPTILETVSDIFGGTTKNPKMKGRCFLSHPDEMDEIFPNVVPSDGISWFIPGSWIYTVNPTVFHRWIVIVFTLLFYPT